MNKAMTGLWIVASLGIGQAAVAADTLFVPGQAETSSWATLVPDDEDDRQTVGALSDDQSMEMQFTFKILIGSPQLFLGLFDAPPERCGQALDSGELTLKAPTDAQAMTVDGQKYPATIDCTEGHTNYAFHGQAATHRITEALRQGNDVTIGIPSDDGRIEHTWSAGNFDQLAGDRVEAYENSSFYHGQ